MAVDSCLLLPEGNGYLATQEGHTVAQRTHAFHPLRVSVALCDVRARAVPGNSPQPLPAPIAVPSRRFAPGKRFAFSLFLLEDVFF